MGAISVITNNRNNNKHFNEFINKLGDKHYRAMVNYMKIILIGEENNGYIRTRDVTDKNISREYLSRLAKEGVIERVERGIYILKDVIPDELYIFQLRYNKTIFSHQTALYFHQKTELFPTRFDITCSREYNASKIKEHNVFYVDKELLDLGMIEIKTNFGNTVKTYDLERTVCDIIRNDNRVNEEQLFKTLRNIINHASVDINKVSLYAKKLKCYDKVMKFLRGYYV